MTDHSQSAVRMYDIRGDKTESSLHELIQQGLEADPKTLPTLLLYDEKGLKLFEEITYLDDYYLTNAEIDALEKHADAIAEHIPAGSRVVELGSGNLRKVNILLKALEKAKKHVDYFALDLSYDELRRTFSELDANEYNYVSFNAFHGTYDDGLAWLSEEEHQDKVNVVLSLGSSIGNFERDEAADFLRGFSRVMKPSDLFIIGIDAVSDGSRIWRAYNDSQGVTERFDRNGLDHANSILGCEAFKQDDWNILGQYVKDGNKHVASYVPKKDVKIGDVLIKAGERVKFEQSVKYVEAECDKLWHDAGLVPQKAFTDASGNQKLYILKPGAVGFELDPKAYAASTIPSVNDWSALWSAWDVATRSMVLRGELRNKPIKLRNNLIFYLGHIPTFADIHFTRATGAAPTDPKYYAQIFERGIDPDVDDPTQCHAHSQIPEEWPPLEEILNYQTRVRNRIVDSIHTGQAAADRKLARGLTLAYEHEAMHLETFLYMLLHGDKILPPPGEQRPDFHAQASIDRSRRSGNAWHTIPATKLVIGADDPENDEGPDRYYLWDNERPVRAADVHQFETQSRPISNGEYAKFLEETKAASLPASWVSDNAASNGHASTMNGSAINGVGGENQTASKAFIAGKAVRTIYGPVTLQEALDWPVMASYDELAAYARWFGGRIPSAEELKSIYHYVDTQKRLMEKQSSSLVPAVNGHLSNNGVEETPPSKPSLSKRSANGAGLGADQDTLFIDLKGCNVGFKHWHPVSVTNDGTRLRGQGDAGGLWEWTSTSFAAHEGFKAMDLYPGYSADFFDNKHNICLGGSWATVPRIAGRKSFVNWYQRNYPFVWCTARLVRDIA